MEKNLNNQFTYFNGVIDEINLKQYTDKKTNEQKEFWAVKVKTPEGEEYNGAIFDPATFSKTPETITDLIGSKINGSWVEDEKGRKRIFLFAPKKAKKNFLSNNTVDAGEYLIKIKDISVFQSKDTHNMFVKYNLDYSSLQSKFSQDAMNALLGIGFTQELAIKQLNKKINDKKATFDNSDWSIIAQISSVAPNKNGKMVEPVKLANGRVFDLIGVNKSALASIIIKAHNQNTEAKWSKAKTLEQLNALIKEENLQGLKEMIKPFKDIEVTLTVKNGKPSLDPSIPTQQFGKLRAFDLIKK